MDLQIPINENRKLEKVAGTLSEYEELDGYLESANVNAMDRLVYSDHGPVHAKIVSNAALKILRILSEREITPSLVDHYDSMEMEDAEVEIVLAAILHDIGMAVHRDNHDLMSVNLAPQILDPILDKVYQGRKKAIMTSNILGTMYPHDGRAEPLTIESGILSIADALDMAEGRTRIPFKAGEKSIHSVSAMAIDEVEINEGGEDEKPVQIKIHMHNSAGIFQVDELLNEKVEFSNLKEHFSIVAEIESREEILKRFEL